MEKKNRINSMKFTNNINLNIFGNDKNFMINKIRSNKINNPNQSGKELSKQKLGNMFDFSPLKNSMTINKIKTPNKTFKINDNVSSVYNIKQFSNNINDIYKQGINPFDIGNNKAMVKSNIKIQEKENNLPNSYEKSKKLIYFLVLSLLPKLDINVYNNKIRQKNENTRNFSVVSQNNNNINDSSRDSIKNQYLEEKYFYFLKK